MVEIQTRTVLKPVEETVVQVSMSIEQAKLFCPADSPTYHRI